ncbi:MAG TPA: hypothetical protein VK531_09205 [Gemmatimonadales bacterium]|nr:hypothetical protein [Gemmatimonadales bacterium]
MRRAFTLVAVVLTVPALLASQSPAHSALSLGAGVNGVGFPSASTLGLVVQAGYLRQYDRIAVRLGADYFRKDYSFSGGESFHPRAIGATLELSYDVLTSRFRPYVIGGWGLYRLRDTQVIAPGTSAYPVDNLSASIVGGLGFRYQVGNRYFFTEARLHGFTGAHNWGSHFMPITAGMRF